MRKFLYINFVRLLLIILFGFVLVFSINIFGKIFFAKDSEIINTGTTAFLGAFLAFIFVRIGDAVRLISDRQRESYNSLVKFERIGNDHLSVVSEIIFVAEDIRRTIEQNDKERRILINFNTFDKFIINDELLFGLLNLDLINKLYVLNIHLKKLNSSICAIERNYVDINRALIEKKIEPDNYIDNLVGIDKKMKLIIAFARDAQKEIRDITALVRVRIAKDKPLFTRIAHWFLISKPISDNDPLLVKEKEQTTSEIEAIASTSKKRIERLLEDHNNTP